MKILEVTNVDFSLYHFLRPLMHALKKENYQVIGICSDGDLLDKVRQEGFEIITVPFVRSYAPLGQLKALWAIYKVIQREKPDMVHAHMPISGFLTRIAAYLCNTPIIAYTCHGYLFNQPGQGIKSWFRRGLSLGLEWIGGKVTDLYMTVSKEEAKDAQRLYIHPHPVAVGNGRNPDVFFPDGTIRRHLRNQFNLTDQQVVFLIASRLVRHKGYPELLCAFKALARVNPNVVLWVVGERLPSDHGYVLDKLFEDTQRALGKQLQMLGYRSDVDQLMKAADVFVLPSHFEGLPMSIIEAMLSALPVISTDIRGPREQIIHRETGLLVQPKNVKDLALSLAWMANHPDERKVIGQAGRQYALKNFTEDQQIKKILRLFNNIKGTRS